MRNPVSLLTVIFSFFLLYSCKQSPVKETSGKSYTYTLQLPPHSKYNCLITNESTTNLEVNDKKVENNNHTNIQLVYEVMRDSAGIYLLKATYTKLRFLVESTEAEDVLIDTDDSLNHFDPAAKLFGEVKGSSIFISLDRKGKVVKVEGSEAIYQKIINSLGADDPETRKQVEQQLSVLAGDGFVKENIELAFSILPDSAIAIGNSWKRSVDQVTGIPFHAISNYTLSSINDDEITVNEKSEINKEGNNSLDIMGYKTAATLSGQMDAKHIIDKTTGMMKSSKSNTAIKGTVQVMGREIPVKIELKRAMEFSPLK